MGTDHEGIETFFRNIAKVEEIYAEEKSQQYIYAIFDYEQNLLYIGQADNVSTRFKAHQKNMPTAYACKYISVEKGSANDIEFYLINKFLPPLNRTSPPKDSYFTLEEYQSYDTKFYSQRIRVLRIIREFDLECINGHYTKEALDFVSSKLNEEQV